MGGYSYNPLSRSRVTVVGTNWVRVGVRVKAQILQGAMTGYANVSHSGCPSHNFTMTRKMPQNVPKCHTFKEVPLLRNPLSRSRERVGVRVISP